MFKLVNKYCALISLFFDDFFYLFLQAINSYFQEIVDEITNHGGDVLKFAGDAVFAEWRIKNNAKHTKHTKDDIYNCVHTAAACGASIVAKCSDYPVYDADGIQISTLNVHCGLAFGELAGVHVGDDFQRREYIILGDVIDKVSKACDVASYGELVASPEAYEILHSAEATRCWSPIQKTPKVEEPVMIASNSEFSFKNPGRRAWNLGCNLKQAVLPPHKIEDLSSSLDKLDTTSLKYFRKMLRLYAHPVVVSGWDRQNNQRVLDWKGQNNEKAIQERHRSEAELRSVYTLFIKPHIRTDLTADKKANDKTFELLNDVLNLTTSVLDHYKGHLRQFIVDDKGKSFRHLFV